MGLDNGIEVRRKDNLPFGIRRLDNDEWRKEHRLDIEVAYWRKCWNVRHIIFDVLCNGDEDDSVIEITRDEVIEIIRRLRKINKRSFYEGPDCCWDWNEFKGINRHNIRNLRRLARTMRWHPDLEVYFYDSY